jgi:hypothetical protein
MAIIPRTSLLFCFFVVVLYDGKSQASTDVYNVMAYGAAMNNGNNKPVSLLIVTNIMAAFT